MTEAEKDAWIVQLRSDVVKYREAYRLTKYQLDAALKEINEELRWRKCAEEMPEEDAPVLFSDGKYIYKGGWTTWDGGHSDFSYETFSGWVEDSTERDYDFNEIKYWMPMPKAPEAE